MTTPRGRIGCSSAAEAPTSSLVLNPSAGGSNGIITEVINGTHHYRLSTNQAPLFLVTRVASGRYLLRTNSHLTGSGSDEVMRPSDRNFYNVTPVNVGALSGEYCTVFHR